MSIRACTILRVNNGRMVVIRNADVRMLYMVTSRALTGKCCVNSYIAIKGDCHDVIYCLAYY